jgi:hypothetical protein
MRFQVKLGRFSYEQTDEDFVELWRRVGNALNLYKSLVLTSYRDGLGSDFRKYKLAHAEFVGKGR